MNVTSKVDESHILCCCTRRAPSGSGSAPAAVVPALGHTGVFDGLNTHDSLMMGGASLAALSASVHAPTTILSAHERTKTCFTCNEK